MRTEHLSGPTTSTSTGTSAATAPSAHDDHHDYLHDGHVPASPARPDLKRRVADVLASSDRPGTSNSPTNREGGDQRDVWNTCADQRSDFRNLTDHTARSLLETRGFRPRLHPRSG